MIVNFRVCEISQGACKLAQTPTLIKKNTSTQDVARTHDLGLDPRGIPNRGKIENFYQIN